jgi:hypothetical protein
METIKIFVGSVVAGSSGQQNDTRRLVQFEGEQLGQYTEYGEGRDGGITDTRGVTQTLYKTTDGRLLVHVDNWSRWQGEPSIEALHQVEEKDLEIGGRFEALGIEAGYARPLTVDEALSDWQSAAY